MRPFPRTGEGSYWVVSGRALFLAVGVAWAAFVFNSAKAALPRGRLWPDEV